MADLSGLIRVRKHELEQKQKFVAELYRQSEELTQQKTRLLTTLEDEQEKLKEFGVEMLSYFGPYSQAVKERVKDINKSSKRLDTRIEIARQDMRNSYTELKKIEITQERRDAEEVKELARKESLDLDEMGIEGFRRQSEE